MQGRSHAGWDRSPTGRLHLVHQEEGHRRSRDADPGSRPRRGRRGRARSHPKLRSRLHRPVQPRVRHAPHPGLRPRREAAGRARGPADHPVPHQQQRPGGGRPVHSRGTRPPSTRVAWCRLGWRSATAATGGSGRYQFPSCTGSVDDPAIELEYAPFGADSGLCVGVAANATHNEGVTLQPCGVTARTTWIIDTNDSPVTLAHGYVPLINGSGSSFSHPFVMTYPANGNPVDRPRPQVQVRPLTGFSHGSWAARSGLWSTGSCWGRLRREPLAG